MKGFEYLKNFLKEENFKFEETESFISFKFQGNYFLTIKKESSYLSIMQTCNAEGLSRSTLLEKCNDLNDHFFIIKFTVHDSKIWCSYEFEPTENTTSDDFVSVLSLLDRASDELLQELSK